MLLRTLARTTTAALLGVALAPAVAGVAGAAAQAAPDDLPAGVPAAATRPEPRLRVPDGWPFEQRLSRTSGTGRLHGGADYWTDFVHDDHGAGIPGGFTHDNVATLAPEQGAYEYPAGPARGNGADVFVAATGADDHATYWRVDWNTLVDADVPIAVWAFDTDALAATGAGAWPARSGLRSDGLDRALVVSSRGAWLHDLRRGSVVDVRDRGGELTVDRDARSFVVRVPRALLTATGRWRVRLATGLASPDGRTMAAPRVAGGLPLPPRAAHAYNVAFRTARQEPAVFRGSRTAAYAAAAERAAAGSPLLGRLGVDGQARFVTGNFWSEDHQADALADGDVTDFARVVDWDRLEREVSTRPPLVRGHSNRWYASRLELGEGVLPDEGQGSGDGRPNFLGRIQPYSVYVPRTYRPGTPAPLTWTLHSLGVNHNQYAGYDPVLQQQLCERRGSICAGTLGHGPDGWYLDEAEADYWSVWGALADGFTLDERRTVITGYSMGGWAAYHLGLAHPDLYAAAVSLAGPPQCGIGVDGGALVAPAFEGRCATDGSAYDLVANARWLPFRIGHGSLDQLVPVTSVERQVQRFDALGLRHRFVRYPAEDHLLFAVQDRFDTVVSGLGRPVVPRRPRDVDLTWRPHLTRPGLGIGATTAYWVGDLDARDERPGSLARVRATSHALPGRVPAVVRTGPTPVLGPLPAVRSDLTWARGARLPRRDLLVLRLGNVESLSLDMRRAGLSCGTLRVRTDGPVALTLLGLPDGPHRIELDGDRALRLPC